jgi:pyruvate dehydrogenase E2 component (dihydrolipoamide acetyltransferase)
MPTEVTLPNLGDGVDSGDILDVLVKEGDQVSKDQGILEIETGKATLQVPSTFAGKVTKVHVATGQTIKPGAVLLTLEAAAKEAVAKAAPAAPKAAQPAKPPPQAAAPAAKAPPQPAAAKQAPPAPAPASEPTPAAVDAPAAPLPEPTTDGAEIAAGPAVRRFAREVGVDLNRVTGSGPGGRITREDVLTVVRQSSHAAGADGSGKVTQRDNWGPIHAEKMTKIRKVIAAKMAESGTTIPRVTNFDDADVTELEKIRQSSKDDYAKKGIKLTSLPFVVKAVAMALRSHPTINASLDLENEQIIYKDYINVGIAVDTDRGLVVPSLRNVDDLSISDIARGLANMSENMREGRINPADLVGSTFSISNLGAIGGTYSTPIINTPEVAILLVGRSRKMPIVVDDEVQIRLMMPLSLSYDHRLVDGGEAARFLNDVIDYLKAPGRLLLAP